LLTVDKRWPRAKATASLSTHRYDESCTHLLARRVILLMLELVPPELEQLVAWTAACRRVCNARVDHCRSALTPRWQRGPTQANLTGGLGQVPEAMDQKRSSTVHGVFFFLNQFSV
jgi:hypothetical protein